MNHDHLVEHDLANQPLASNAYRRVPEGSKRIITILDENSQSALEDIVAALTDTIGATTISAAIRYSIIHAANSLTRKLSLS